MNPQPTPTVTVTAAPLRVVCIPESLARKADTYRRQAYQLGLHYASLDDFVAAVLAAAFEKPAEQTQ